MADKTTVDPANGDPGNQPSAVSTAVAGAKKILGREPAKANTVLMPKSLAEIHTAPDEMIPAGTLLTPEVLDAANLDDAAVDGLLRRGHALMVEVYAGALTENA